MKAICITNRNHDTPERNGRNAMLTIGKVYDVRCYALDYYAVVSDAGRDIAVPNYYFKPLDEYRQETIDQLLSEPSFILFNFMLNKLFLYFVMFNEV